MKLRRLLLVAMGCIFAGVCGLVSWAEDAGGGIPAVTGLRAAIRADTVILSWNDDGPEAKAYAVYRSESTFAGAPLAGIASIAVVAPGKQGYTDRPPQGRAFYYAVAAISADGQVLFSFAANQNATVVAISAEAPAKPEPLAAPALPAAQPAQAAAQPPKPATPPAQGSPATEAAAVQVPVAPIPMVEASPPPAPETPAARLPEGAAPGPGTGTPVVASSAAQAGPEAVRSIPLPEFVYGESPLAAGRVGRARDTSGSMPPETAKALYQMQDETDESAPAGPELRFLPRSPKGGDASTILLAAESLLGDGDWQGASVILESLIKSGSASPESECAHFYLGVSLTKQGRLREALFEFLSARDAYPVQTKPWIDYVVESLGRT